MASKDKDRTVTQVLLTSDIAVAGGAFNGKAELIRNGSFARDEKFQNVGFRIWAVPDK